MMNPIYLALGDSITAGYGVSPQQAFTALFYNKLLAVDPSLKYVNLGVNGLTSQELASMLVQNRVYALLPQAKVISMTIGSNDLLSVGRGLTSGVGANTDLILGNLNRNLMLIGERIRTANSSALVKIAVLYNPLPPVDKNTDALVRGLVKTANHSIRHMAREYRLVVINVDKALSGREQLLLGPDHLHPNVLGHQMFADLFSKH